MNCKVLVTSRSFGQVSDEAIRLLEDARVSLTYMTRNFKLQEFERAIPDYDALIIGGHPFRAELFEQCPKLKLICKHGVGLDNIPLRKAKEHDVRVTNTPGTLSDAVADFAIMMLLATARNFVYSVNALKEGNYKANIGVDLHHKTLGLLGFGAISRRVAKRAKGFDMKILAFDPYVKEVPEEFKDVKLCSLEELLPACDFLSIHLPITEETRGMIGREELAKMKPTARLVNTARGGIVDEAALYDAIAAGELAGAGLDVVEHEPLPMDNRLLTRPEIIVTNHVASYSKEALNAVSMICAKNVLAYFGGGELLNRVV